MAVRTGCLHTGSVFVMNVFFVFGKGFGGHLMTGSTKFHGVGEFHRGVEATPKDNTTDAADNELGSARARWDA